MPMSVSGATERSMKAKIRASTACVSQHNKLETQPLGNAVGANSEARARNR